MRIKLLQRWSAPHGNYNEGQIVEVPDDLGKSMVKDHYAVELAANLDDFINGRTFTVDEVSTMFKVTYDQLMTLADKLPARPPSEVGPNPGDGLRPGEVVKVDPSKVVDPVPVQSAPAEVVETTPPPTRVIKKAKPAETPVTAPTPEVETTPADHTVTGTGTTPPKDILSPVTAKAPETPALGSEAIGVK